MIESLSEDRARLLEEKKKLEEEVSKLRSSSFIPPSYGATAPELCGACAPELPCEAERLATEVADEGRIDSAMETSMMSVQYVHIYKATVMILALTNVAVLLEILQLNEILLILCLCTLWNVSVLYQAFVSCFSYTVRMNQC